MTLHLDDRRLLELVVCAGDLRRGRVALVQDDAVGEGQRLARGQSVVTGLSKAEVVPSKRVGREQPVGSHVPGGREAEAARVVEHGDPHGLTANLPGVVDPGRSLAPRLGVGQSLGVDDLPPLRLSTSILLATRRPNMPSFVSPKVTAPAEASITTSKSMIVNRFVR